MFLCRPPSLIAKFELKPFDVRVQVDPQELFDVNQWQINDIIILRSGKSELTRTNTWVHIIHRSFPD